jgi:hypothetical protein
MLGESAPALSPSYFVFRWRMGASAFLNPAPKAPNRITLVGMRCSEELRIRHLGHETGKKIYSLDGSCVKSAFGVNRGGKNG